MGQKHSLHGDLDSLDGSWRFTDFGNAICPSWVKITDGDVKENISSFIPSQKKEYFVISQRGILEEIAQE